MRKIITSSLLLFVFVLLSFQTFGQYNYISINSGTWTGASTWSRDVAGTGSYSPTTVAPTTANAVSVTINHAITTTATTIVLPRLTINPGTLNNGSLTFNGATRSLTITNALVINSGGTLTMSSGTTLNMNINTSLTVAGTLVTTGNSTINSGATVSVTTGTFTNNGTFTMNSGTTISIASGTLNNNGILDLNGTSLLMSGGSITNSNTMELDLTPSSTVGGTLDNFGVFNINTGAITVSGMLNNYGSLASTPSSLIFSSGSTYNHNESSIDEPLPIPLATWDANSTISILSAYATPANLDQTFGNFIWNNGVQTDALDFAGALTSIGGYFQILSTGTGSIALNSSNGSNDLNIAGEFFIGSGSVGLSVETTAPLTVTVGSLTLTGDGFLALTDAANVDVVVNGTFSFSVDSQLDFSLSSGLATLTVNDFTQGGAATFNNSAGNLSNLIVRADWEDAGSFNPNGITVTFNGPFAQTINSVSATSFYGLTIDNPLGVTLAGANTNYTVAGPLTLASGTLNIGARTLTLNNTVVSSGGTFTGGTTSNLSLTGVGSGTLPEIIDGLNNLSITRPAAVIALSTPLNLNGYLTLTSGTLNSNGNLSVDLNSGGINGSGVGAVGGDVTVSKILNSLQYFSTPLPGTEASQLNELIAINGESLYSYDETNTSQDKNIGFVGIGDPSAQLTPGVGYVYGGQSGSLSVTGNYIHTAEPSVNVTLTPSGNADADGWNLIGNPFPSIVDWDDVTISGINNAIYFRDAVNQRFVTYIGPGGSGVGINGGTSSIPPMQAFWVKATGSGSVTFNQESRVDNQSLSNYRIAAPTNLLRVIVKGDGASDETVIRINNNATLDFDSDFDAYKFANSGTTPSIYTSLNKKDLSINTVPDFFDSLTIPLNIKARVDGNYTFTTSGISSFSESFQSIVLTDKVLNVKQDLLKATDYSAYIKSTDAQSGRFFINFRKDATITDLEEGVSNNFYIFNKEGIVTVKFDEIPTGNNSIIINNLQGQPVYQLSQADLSSGKVTFNTNLSNGLYIVKIITANRTFAKKLLLN